LKKRRASPTGKALRLSVWLGYSDFLVVCADDHFPLAFGTKQGIVLKDRVREQLHTSLSAAKGTAYEGRFHTQPSILGIGVGILILPDLA